MSTPTAQVRVSLDKAQAERDAESFSSTLRDNFTDLASGANLANRAFDYMQAALGGVVSFMREGIIASAEAAAGEARLEQALRVRGIATDGVVDKLNNYNSVMMQSTGLADDQLLALQAQLIALGVQRDRLQEATTAAIGLSEISGKGLVQSGTIVARVLDGQISALSRYKAGLSSTAEAMEFLTSRATLAGSNLQTVAGQWALLTGNIGELQEALGDPVARSAGVLGALQGANDVLVGATAAVQSAGKAANEAAGGDGFGGLMSVMDQSYRVVIPGYAQASDLLTGVLGRMGREAKEAASNTENIARVLGRATVAVEEENFGNTEGDATSKAEMRRRFGRGREMAAKEEGAAIAKARAEGEREYQLRLADYSPDQFVGPIDPDETQFALAEQSAEVAFEIARYREDTLAQIERDGAEARFQEQVAAYDRQQAGFASFITDGINLAGQFGGALAANLGAAAKSGASAADVAEQALGGVLQAIGQSLIAMGTAAIVAGVLGTAVPWLSVITGGPAAVVAGTAAVIAGGLLAAGGGYLSANAPKAPSAGSGGRSRGGSSSRTEADNQTFGSGGGPVNSTFIVNVNGGIFAQDGPRALRDMLESGDRLRPERRRW